MFHCPRCGTRFNAGAASSALICPRCRAKDGVFSPLTFWIFDVPRPAAGARDQGAAEKQGGKDG